MRRIRLFWKSIFDVRAGEGVRTLFMALHLLCVLFAYYILKPVSRGLFLTKFDIDKLPYLYILIALVGGILVSTWWVPGLRSTLAAGGPWLLILAVGYRLSGGSSRIRESASRRHHGDDHSESVSSG